MSLKNTALIVLGAVGLVGCSASASQTVSSDETDALQEQQGAETSYCHPNSIEKGDCEVLNVIGSLPKCVAGQTARSLYEFNNSSNNTIPLTIKLLDESLSDEDANLGTITLTPGQTASYTLQKLITNINLRDFQIVAEEPGLINITLLGAHCTDTELSQEGEMESDSSSAASYLAKKELSGSCAPNQVMYTEIGFQNKSASQAITGATLQISTGTFGLSDVSSVISVDQIVLLSSFPASNSKPSIQEMFDREYNQALAVYPKKTHSGKAQLAPTQTLDIVVLAHHCCPVHMNQGENTKKDWDDVMNETERDQCAYAF